MKKMILEKDDKITEHYIKCLEDRLETLFPKKKCKERGAALVYHAWAIIYLRHAVMQTKVEEYKKGFNDCLKDNKLTGEKHQGKHL